MSNATHFYTGYYSGKNEIYDEISKRLEKDENLQFMDNEDESADDQNIYYDASIFLQGSCQLFSLALHQEFGYDAFEIRKGTSCHFFCKAVYNGETVYIDVRGITASWDEFLSGTRYDFTNYDKIIPQDIEEDAKLSGPYEKEGLAFAKHLIHEHPKYYNIGTP